MAKNLLEEVGSKLENPPANKDALIKLLKQAAASLSEIEQSPSKAVLESMQPLVTAIVKPELLKHHDKEIKLLVATCTCEITRITAPEAPYDDDILKDIFHLIVSTFNGLRDTKGPSFGRRVTILKTVAKYRSCVVMLDLDCEELIKEMFRTFFAVVSDEHSESVILSMKTIMVVLLEESEEINEDLLLIILSVLGRDKRAITMSARRLAMSVIGHCAVKLEPGIKQFIVKSMSGEESSPSISQIDYHEVIYDIYRCAPQALAGIVPYLTGELLTDKIDVRLKAVKLVGDLFSIPGSSISEAFYPIFLEFLKRLADIVVEVRMSVLEHVKRCMLSNPYRLEAPQLTAALCDRLLDYDESIRQKVVAVVSDLACHELSSISLDTVKLLADRLRDKSLPVKKYTMERLSDVYRTCCSDLTRDGYDWIPGRIIRCFYDKDFRSDTVEHVLCTTLFPADFSVRDKVTTWIRVFSKFDSVEVKALEKILEQKQRLQLELQKYFSLREMYNKFQESDASDIQKKVTLCFRVMSHCFTDPTKAEADFLLLHQLKDANVWKMLRKLLDPNTTSLQACRYRDELLNVVGQKHPLHGFLSTLSVKCSYILFNKDDVKRILLEAKSSQNSLLTQSCMNILVIIASFSPLLLSGAEKELVHLVEDDNEVIKEGVLHVLAKAGGTIRELLGEASSTLDLLLERICLEGSRRQAKYAVHALVSITKDDGLKSLSVLYKKLVEMLEKKTHLPSVLQSLGCIAQLAMPVFETQETKIQGFIKENILGCSEETSDKTKESWDDKSQRCLLKIYGIKTLVKSYLPVKDAHLRVGIGELIKVLKDMLSIGEFSKDIESSSIDKAHLKLASAKAILRLSKLWDKAIPIDVFYLTLRTSEIGFPEVKKRFLNKVYQYIKDRSLDPKYVCAYFLGLKSEWSLQDQKSEEYCNLNDIIQMCQQGKVRQLSMQSDGNSSVVHPEYMLPYLIHALAHHPSCPNVDECKDLKAYEPIYRKLYVFLSMLALGDEEGKAGKSLKKEEVFSVLSILQSIRSSEDAVSTSMSKKSYAICDLCFSITKRLAQNQEELQEPLVHVSLPQVLYRPYDKKHDKKEEMEEKEYKKEEEKEEKKVDEKDEKEKVDEKDEKEKEDKNHVTERQTWLADADALAHFELLNMEANDSVPSNTIEDVKLKDSETDDNEVPLGKLLKRIKAKVKERKEAMKIGSTLPAAETNDSNVDNFDILGMVREINLDSLGVPSKFESINGHEVDKTEEKRKRKRIPTEKMNMFVPKRQRSKELSVFDSIKMSDINDLSLEPTHSDDRGHIQKEYENGDKTGVGRLNKYMDTDGNKKSGSSRKRKPKSVTGLAKCSSKEVEGHTTDLIGKRIKIWWPLDKAFYEGLVKSYDGQKKRHVVLYNDGDVEVVRLDKERWELIANTPKAKKNKLSKSLRPIGRSTKTKSKVLDKFKKIKSVDTDRSPSSMVRGKRTPRKNTKQRKKAVSRRTLEYLEEERKADSDMAEPEPEPELEPVLESDFESEHVTFSKVDNLDTEEESSDREEAKDAGNGFIEGQSSGTSEKSNEDDIDTDPDTHDEAELSDDMPLSAWKSQKETENGPGSDQEEDEKQSSGTSEKSNEDDVDTDPDTHDEAELSDDMPLGAWKSQIRKAGESK
uniref:sister chromatid cohesion protein PDS5 homolog A isoform X2 n=1 Tax=Erigeron canadensis TaxID=72917 RepID=UPI001CB8F896|nr:sister chromatid cohesion protein PDS5 homolog A isoform X2 [Erigeron canadensis]